MNRNTGKGVIIPMNYGVIAGPVAEIKNVTAGSYEGELMPLSIKVPQSSVMVATLEIWD
jgi:hypothetical protein